MTLYSYIVTVDNGFAPNPFWGYCTLACCKPKIRRTAQIGDWIVGLSPRAKGNKIIYAMEVKEILPYADYWQDSRFTKKIPSCKDIKHSCGDNIYKPRRSRGFDQLPSMHSWKGENRKKKAIDLKGEKVLISKKFYYFGSQPLKLPKKLYRLRVGRGHRSRSNDGVISIFLKFIAKQRKECSAYPTMWGKGNDSCKKCSSC